MFTYPAKQYLLAVPTCQVPDVKLASFFIDIQLLCVVRGLTH